MKRRVYRIEPAAEKRPEPPVVSRLQLEREAREAAALYVHFIGTERPPARVPARVFP